MNQDSASAPTPHPHGPCPYTRDIWHSIRGGIDLFAAVDADKANCQTATTNERAEKNRLLKKEG